MNLKKGYPSNYYHICPQELDHLIKSNSFFARKFNDNCVGLDKLKTIY